MDVLLAIELADVAAAGGAQEAGVGGLGGAAGGRGEQRERKRDARIAVDAITAALARPAKRTVTSLRAGRGVDVVGATVVAKITRGAVIRGGPARSAGERCGAGEPRARERSAKHRPRPVVSDCGHPVSPASRRPSPAREE
ncbi:hypothetical protein OV079_49675 [Nannocystis pusilla]|uniref:Uncharacterized protein n=1 Tax=Nannocystis pusilla TaxID=889268 RepID=A0A9X3J435_9BACT|nr:hypothetical protein [Nannocystis pusilla]MCY1013469.1 hypothetical protein [Nannocystis pusilla]